MSTGLRAGTNNDGYLQVNGTDILTALSSGRIGIGTDNPSKSLSILSSQSVMLQLESTSSTARIGFKVPNTSNSPTIGVSDEEDLQFRTGNNERLRIDSSGRVLIGSDTGTKNITLKLQGHNNNSTSDAKLRLCRGNSTPTSTNQLGAIAFSDSSETPSAEIIVTRDNGTWSESSKPGALVFYTTPDTTTLSEERLRITSDGQVKATGPGSGGSVISSKVTTNNGGFLAYQGIASNDTTTFSVNHNGTIYTASGIQFETANTGTDINTQTLDDYEEGTWTPSINAGSVGSWDWQTGRYTKIGNVVTIWFDIEWNNATSIPSTGQITGLPFTAIASNTQGGYGAPVFRDAGGVHSDIRIYGNSSYVSGPTSIIIQGYESNGNTAAKTFNSSGRVTGWAQYFTNNAY